MLGSLIGAVGGIASSLLGKKSADKAAAQNAALQKEFAQSGIQWKVEDAKKAGIHPLYALGAQTQSFSPAFVGSDFSGIAQAGQDIGRAIDATRSPSGRVGAFEKTVQDLQVQRLGLENELLASQIAKVRQAGQPPPIPSAGDAMLIDGQGDSPLQTFKDVPLERVTSFPSRPFQEGGAVTDLGYSRTASGGYAPVPSKDVQERMEDNWLAQMSWMLRNQFAPSLLPGYGSPPPVEPRPGYLWVYNPLTQEYVQRKRLFGRVTY